MIASGIFSFLREETQRSFGEGSYLFFPATRGGSSYTVIIPCTAGTNRGKTRDLTGLLTMGTDSRSFDVDASAVPFDPRPEDIVLFGTPLDDPENPGGFIADPDHPPARYRLTGADKATFHSHWHLTAELHA